MVWRALDDHPLRHTIAKLSGPAIPLLAGTYTSMMMKTCPRPMTAPAHAAADVDQPHELIHTRIHLSTYVMG
jgi:hypothetical protein